VVGRSLATSMLLTLYSLATLESDLLDHTPTTHATDTNRINQLLTSNFNFGFNDKTLVLYSEPEKVGKEEAGLGRHGAGHAHAISTRDGWK